MRIRCILGEEYYVLSPSIPDRVALVSNIAPVSWFVYHGVMQGREHQHADESKEVFEKDSMPHAPYLLLHPGARLSAAEKRQLEEGLLKLAKTYGR